jgi:hypothetical protein
MHQNGFTLTDFPGLYSCGLIRSAARYTGEACSRKLQFTHCCLEEKLHFFVCWLILFSGFEIIAAAVLLPPVDMHSYMCIMLLRFQYKTYQPFDLNISCWAKESIRTYRSHYLLLTPSFSTQTDVESAIAAADEAAATLIATAIKSRI